MRSVCVENNVEHKNNEHSRSPLLKKTQDWKIIGVFFFVQRKMRLIGIIIFFLVQRSFVSQFILIYNKLSKSNGHNQLMGHIPSLGPPRDDQ